MQVGVVAGAAVGIGPVAVVLDLGRRVGGAGVAAGTGGKLEGVSIGSWWAVWIVVKGIGDTE
jgi:hypothetical protein